MMTIPSPSTLWPIVVTIIGWPITAYLAYLWSRRSQKDSERRAAKQALTTEIYNLLLAMQHEGDLNRLRWQQRKEPLARAIAAYCVFLSREHHARLQDYLKRYENVESSKLEPTIETMPDGRSVLTRSRGIAALSQPLKDMLEYIDAI